MPKPDYTKYDGAASEVRSDALLGADDFAYSTLDEYESIVGFTVNEAFRAGWTMARTTNRMLSQLAPNGKDETHDD